MTTKIEWTDETWNPLTGCTKISEGCRNCYAERMSKRLAGRCGYPADEPFKVTLHPDRLEQPLHWKKPRRVFVCSMSDLFHEDVPLIYIRDVWTVFALARQHTYQVLTKRPGRMLDFVRQAVDFYGEVFDHVWLGVTAENQKAADERIPILLQIPAAVRFVSVEPMLGSVDLDGYLGDLIQLSDDQGDIGSGLDWVICGGETGPGARPMHPDWARSLRDQCQEAGVPLFFKHWGEWRWYEGPPATALYAQGTGFYRVGKSTAGRLLDGRNYSEFPYEGLDLRDKFSPHWRL